MISGKYTAAVLLALVLVCLVGIDIAGRHEVIPSSYSRPIQSLSSYIDQLNASRYLTQLLASNSSTETCLCEDISQLPVIYLIMPTYPRMTQKADITKFIYTMIQVPRIHWIVVEDWPHKTDLVTRMLNSSGLNYTHLNAVSAKNSSTGGKRGVMQRNAGLEWIRNNTELGDEGVLYFADDDNTYDIRIFELMRYTKNVSVWPVGLVGAAPYESVNVQNKSVIGWHVNYAPWRKFAVDMAGFAINIRLLHEHPSANFYYKMTAGYQETQFIESLKVTMSDLEPVAHNQTEVLVWHTQTVKFGSHYRPPGPDLEI